MTGPTPSYSRCQYLMRYSGRQDSQEGFVGFETETMKAGDPLTVTEWQEAVDLASALLHLHSARAYGLVRGGPEINVERCEQLLAAGKQRGVAPSPDHVERFVAAHNAR